MRTTLSSEPARSDPQLREAGHAYGCLPVGIPGAEAFGVDGKLRSGMTHRQVVVITGASAGIARATARQFGARGAQVALLARGQAGLDGAAKDVENAGGSALAIPTDVADYDQLDAAATQVEDTFGPIDVWINVAFTSVFAPFHEIGPEEFRRVTEVSYLGFVYGTMVALARMRPRDRGTIVQVGSALGERSIPLQSAYCGAKHAINGFTESLRTELMHDGSNIAITVVQMPAVNTPQFSWVLSRLPNHPQPVPPIYQPEVAARGVVFAADHPRRKQYWVGASTVGTLLGQKIAPALLDRYLAKTGYQSQQTSEKADPDRPHNLWRPVDGKDGHDHGARGVFNSQAHGHCAQLWFSHHVRLVSSVLAGAGTAGLATAILRLRRR
jgi:NAD(P)-dependent dehydrogenase (short-subunit alcohol dehydrogenase family)